MHAKNEGRRASDSAKVSFRGGCLDTEWVAENFDTQDAGVSELYGTCLVEEQVGASESTRNSGGYHQL